MSTVIHEREMALLVRDKYGNTTPNEASAEYANDLARLAAGEPLAYVIGWIPFLDLQIGLDAKPLIPRPETEAWTEQLVAHLSERFGDQPFRFLDLCAGSGAIGLAVLAACPHAHVTFAELVPELADLIQKNISTNDLDASRATVCTSDVFSGIAPGLFDIIATNPPYIPAERELDTSVTSYEPSIALFSGTDGLDLIRRIAKEARAHLSLNGELWMECDISNVDTARELLLAGGAAHAEVHTDVYDRPRLVLAYY